MLVFKTCALFGAEKTRKLQGENWLLDDGVIFEVIPAPNF